MNMKLRGPEGARQRLDELQARIESFQPKKTHDFAKVMAPVSDETLEGPIAPMNPFGGKFELRSQATPEIKRMIQQAAEQAGVDPKLFDALVATESNYDPRARSRAGAMGLAQLMPGTAQELGVTDPFDPVQNLQGGARYLAKMLERFGDPRLALAAYNAGPGSVERAGNRIPNITETQRYVAKVMSIFEGRRGG